MKYNPHPSGQKVVTFNKSKTPKRRSSSTNHRWQFLGSVCPSKVVMAIYIYPNSWLSLSSAKFQGADLLFESMYPMCFKEAKCLLGMVQVGPLKIVRSSLSLEVQVSTVWRHCWKTSPDLYTNAPRFSPSGTFWPLSLWPPSPPTNALDWLTNTWGGHGGLNFMQPRTSPLHRVRGVAPCLLNSPLLHSLSKPSPVSPMWILLIKSSNLLHENVSTDNIKVFTFLSRTYNSGEVHLPCETPPPPWGVKWLQLVVW